MLYRIVKGFGHFWSLLLWLCKLLINQYITWARKTSCWKELYSSCTLICHWLVASDCSLHLLLFKKKNNVCTARYGIDLFDCLVFRSVDTAPSDVFIVLSHNIFIATFKKRKKMGLPSALLTMLLAWSVLTWSTDVKKKKRLHLGVGWWGQEKALLTQAQNTHLYKTGW